MTEILYKDLSYVLNGIFFDVYNTIGYGKREKAYCQAIIKALYNNKIKFLYQFKVPLIYHEHKIGNRYADFFIDDKIIVEIKVGKTTSSDFNQIKEYLNVSGLKLGLLVAFKKEEVKIYRVLNLY
ncbi:MAG TPA: GxxExxY protein [Candidatus Bipolaricaulota bacterium]|nr:GxxExxY protein [Candidatus Bipolaricaulota bacterium]